jgi:protein ImuB
MADALYACVSMTAPAASDAASAALPAIAADFSPRFEHVRAGSNEHVIIDVSGLERLIGPPRVIGEELRRTIAARRLCANVAVAGTHTAARVLAHGQPGLTVSTPGVEAQTLASLPIALVETIPSFDVPLAVFRSWGLKTLGELAALPQADLVARFGRQALDWQALARGEDVRPLVPTLDEERFESTLELEWPIDGLEPLSFVLTRLLEPLSTRLERRDRGAAALHVLLRLVSREIVARRLELPAPMREVRALRTLALLDLESHPPGAAIDRVTVVIDPTPGRVVQHRLFARAQPTPEQLSTLLARLGALMGADRIGAPVPVDTYRPGAFAMKPFPIEVRGPDGSRARPASPPDEDIVTALRRCRHPVPARVAVVDGRPVRVTTDRRGFAGGAVRQCAGPWRTSGNWWEAGHVLDPRERDSASAPGRGAVGPPRPVVDPREPDGASAPGRGAVGPPRPVLDTREHYGASVSGVGVGPHANKDWDRDEWDVALSDGAVYRVFRDRDTDRWFIDAICD